jgi:hypothetical protein
MMIKMTVNDLMKILNDVPCAARLYTSDPENCWLSEVKNVVVHYDETLNQTWVEFVKSDD